MAWKGHVHWSSAQILLSRGVSNDSNIKRCWKINFCDIWRSSFREKWLYPFRRWVSVTSSRCLHSGGLYLITNILKQGLSEQIGILDVSTALKMLSSSLCMKTKCSVLVLLDRTYNNNSLSKTSYTPAVTRQRCIVSALANVSVRSNYGLLKRM